MRIFTGIDDDGLNVESYLVIPAILIGKVVEKLN